MSHKSQMQFVEYVRRMFPWDFELCRVLEIGSRNINGTVRDLFFLCDYVGLDCVAGTDVDVVSLAHEYDAEPFDTIITCETLEHDPHWPETVANALRLLKSGGLFVATWAGPGREEHGTSATGEAYGPNPSYYHNISEDEFLSAIDDAFNEQQILTRNTQRGAEDVYFWGVKR